MSTHQFASGLCADPQVNISSSYYYYKSYNTIILIYSILMKYIIELMYCMKLNVLLYYLGCKLYDHLLQIRVHQ